MRTCSRTYPAAAISPAFNAAIGGDIATLAFQIHWKKGQGSLLIVLPIFLLMMTDSELEVLFRTWWQQSYPTPPGAHALLTHIGWARFLLEQLQQQREQQR